jgi:hypothetical protein
MIDKWSMGSHANSVRLETACQNQFTLFSTFFKYITPYMYTVCTVLQFY